MITSKTTLGLMAIFAASVLVTGALVATPSYASKGKDKDGVSGDGNTITIQISKGEAKAFGTDVTATNNQKNCLTFKLASC